MSAHTASSARRPYFWPFVALAAVAAVIGALLLPTSAKGASVALSGVVHNASGAVLAGVTVTAIDVETFDTSTTKTSSTGAFAFAALPTAQYTLSFSATSSTYFQYLGETADPADAEVIPLSLTTTGNGAVYLPVDLAASGTITGRVTTLANVALKAYTVRAYQQNDDGSWTVAASATTGSTGAYTITGLAPGGLRLEAIDTTSAHPVYSPVFSGGTTEVSTATSVGVLPAKTSTYNFALGKAGSVSGTVAGAYGASGTEALAGVRVTAYALSGTGYPYDSGTALDSPTTTTAANGAYTLSGLMPGPYTLEFQPPATAAPAPASAIYGRTFLGNADTSTSAAYFQIGNGTVLTGKNVTLVAGATIAGIVKNEATSAGLGNIEVIADYAYQDPDAPSEHAASALTANDGSFSLAGLGPGTYDLYVGTNASIVPGQQVVGDTSWIRQAVSVGPLTSGEDLNSLSIGMSPKTDGAMTATVQPTISAPSGTAVGDTVSAGNGTWDSTPTSETYQWLDNGTVISGATQQNYTLRPGDAGDSVAVRVTAYNFSYGTGVATSTAIAEVGAGTFPTPTPGPSIDGTAQVGHTLTANTGYWSVPGTAFTFLWQASPDNSTWTSLELPSSPTLTVSAADYAAGPYIRVQVFASRTGYIRSSAYGTLGTAVATAPITMLKAPTVKKTSTDFEVVGGTFSPAGTNPNGVSYMFGTEGQYGGGGGSNSQTGVLPIAGTSGEYIYVTEERQLDGYTTYTTPDILVQTGAAPTASGNVTMTGTTQVGQYLDAPNANWSNTGGAITRQWQYKSGSTWRNITGATNSSYQAMAGDLGHLLRVITTLTNPGFAPGTLVSQAPGVITAGEAPTYISGSWTGTIGTADTVTADPSWSGNPATFGYQWEYSATASAPYAKISGATRASYTIPQSLLGKHLFLVETASTPGYATGSNLLSLGQVAPDQLTLVKPATVGMVDGTSVINPPTFSPAVPAPVITYAWYYDDENDGNPTQYVPFTTSSADLALTPEPHAHWFVIATVQAGGDGQYTYLNAAPTLVRKGDIIPSGTITLPPSKAGDAITPPAITWLVQNPTLAHQWQYLSAGKWYSIAASAGGTGATFTPSGSYVGKEIRVITTASRTNYTTVSTISSTTTVGMGDQLAPNSGPGAPALIGNAQIGARLTAVPGTWSQSGVTFHYEWDSSPSGSVWTAIPGAISTSYLIPDAAYNTLQFRVIITASKAGFTTGSTTLYAAGAATAGVLTNVKLPTTKLAAGKYSVSGGTWSEPPTGLDYAWYSFDRTTNASTPIGTDSASYTLTPGDAGKLIQVQVTARRTNYASAESTLTAQLGSSVQPTSAITLDGTAVVGSNLAVDNPGWNADSPTVDITWYRNGVLNPAFTNDQTYSLSAPDFGKKITAKLTVSKPGYLTSTFTLASSLVESNVTLAVLAAPAISGTAAADDTLTASPGVWNVAGLTYTYQWYRDDTAIPGATASSYLVSAADVGEDLTVNVTASRALYSPNTVNSQPVTVTEGAAIVNTAANPITISGLVGGEITFGHALTATVAAKWNMPVSLTYDWQFSSGIVWQDLVGANGATYTPEAGDNSDPPVGGGLTVGSHVRVVVYASRPGHPTVEVDGPYYFIQS